MRKIACYAAALILMIFFAGCEEPTLENVSGIEIKLAPIDKIDIQMLTSTPPQIQVYIKGGLADSCTTFHAVKTERSVDIFKITVAVQRPREAVCAQIFSYFEKCENLGSDFVPGETYTVYVNDQKTSFVMPCIED